MFDFFKVQKVTEKKQKIKIAEDFENINLIAEYFKNETGIDFENQKPILKSKVTTFCRNHDVPSFKKCLENICNDIKFKQSLINYLTTNESFFYREFHQITSLVEKVKASSDKVEILCVPSATGEEPYSIAIALLEAGVSIERFYITGVDISSSAIKKSQQAIYNEKSVRNLSASIRSSYFKKKKDLYHLNEDIKRKTSFKCINIFDEEFAQLGKFNYIFSRNMLIYFDNDTRLKAKFIFMKHLVDKREEIYFGHADLL